LEPEHRQAGLDLLEKAKKLIGDMDAIKNFESWAPSESEPLPMSLEHAVHSKHNDQKLASIGELFADHL
jgi:hypothetical protein